MDILLIEDTEEKRNSIEDVIISNLSETGKHYNITYAKDIRQARRFLCTINYDLIIFDMYLPDTHGTGSERDCSEELIQEFSVSKNYQTESIALTQFDINQIENIQNFNRAGITLVRYSEGDDWQVALNQKINRASQKIKCDFLIFCALSKERNAYSETELIIGNSRNIFGLDCLEASLNGKNGFIIKPQNMGLVNMAITSSKAIEAFQPKIVAMSGICAGVEGESNYLDLIVGRTCWEYQTGKWKDGEFKQEPYQVNITRSLHVDIEQSCNNPRSISYVREGLFATELATMKIRLAPMSSGSAVIADQEMMQRIGMQHRKMAGLEMEMYSLYEAAAQSLCDPLCFGVKAVVDMGSNSKGDAYHQVGCITSARYVTLILIDQLEKIK